MRHVACFGLAVAALAWGEAADGAGTDVAEVFASLYGRDLAAVAATADPHDDVALARRLLEAAPSAAAQKPLVALMLHKAHDLALADPTGYPAALEAMGALEAAVPELRLACRVQALAVYQRMYDAARGDAARASAGATLLAALEWLADAKAEAGDLAAASELIRRAVAVASAEDAGARDALVARLADLTRRERHDRRAALLWRRLGDDPADTVSREALVRLYLVEYDAPGRAATVLDASCDADLRKYVPAAAKGVADAPELACLELGDWYLTLADRAAPEARPALHRRAMAYYRRFLDLHPAADLARTRATLALAKAEAQAGPAAPPAAPVWPSGPGSDVPAPVPPADDLPSQPPSTPPSTKQPPAKQPPAGPPPRTPAEPAVPAWPGDAVDLLALIELPRDELRSHGGSATTRDAEGLTFRSDQAVVAVPAMPVGDYELLARVRLKDGRKAFCMQFPVGLAVTTVEFVTGETAIRDVAPEHAEGAVSQVRLSGNDRLYRVRVTGRSPETVRLQAWANDQPLLDWRGPATALTCQRYRWEGQPGDGRVAFRTKTGLVLMAAGVRILEGELRRPAGAAIPRAPREFLAASEDLLALVEVPRDVCTGSVEKRDGVLEFRWETAIVAFPRVVRGNYELFVVGRTPKRSMFLLVPVGDTLAEIEIMNTAIALRNVPGESDRGLEVQHPVSTGVGMALGHRVRVETEGETVRIRAWTGYHPILDWAGTRSDLGPVGKYWRQAPKDGRIAIKFREGKLWINECRLRMLGEAGPTGPGTALE